MRISLCLAALFVAACGSPDTGSQNTPTPESNDDAMVADTAHNSRNSLDWPGSYNGFLPCADCEAIQTTVTLRADGSFERTLVYVGKSAEPSRQSGQFSWDAAGSIVTLALPDGSMQMYQVGENLLFHLDQAGNRITGDLSPQYVLRQAIHDPRIEDRRWLLVEVTGQAYEPAEDGRAAFILLDSAESRASGNNSCNNFFGRYAIEAGQRIRFSDNMGATMMACPDMTTEAAFMEALRMVDNYSVSGNELSLNKARMAPLLRFALQEEQSEPQE
jgi:heat shock protein HslJ